MPRKKAPASAQDPVLQLKILALQDDPLVQEYRDIHYQLVIDSLQASGQRIASGERVVPLSDAEHTRLMKQHVGLSKRICKKYKISGFQGGDPYFVKKGDWLATIQVSLNKRLQVETNWETSFSPAVQFHVIPKTAKPYVSKIGTIYQLPSLPKDPQASPCMTIHLDLSQVKPNALAPLAKEFKQAVKRCLTELPQSHRKPRSPWEQNIQRDYSRFRRFQQGMPFRWIAYQEKTGRSPSAPITGPVPTESSVRESVERVHLAVFGEKFSAKRHRRTLRDQALRQACNEYRCSEHGRECPFTCNYFQDYQKKTIEPLLK